MARFSVLAVAWQASLSSWRRRRRRRWWWQRRCYRHCLNSMTATSLGFSAAGLREILRAAAARFSGVAHLPSYVRIGCLVSLPRPYKRVSLGLYSHAFAVTAVAVALAAASAAVAAAAAFVHNS